MSTDPAFLAGALCAFVLAGFVKGVLGFGLPTVLVAGLALFLPPAQAVALMLLPSFVTNVAQAAVGGHLRELVVRQRWFLGGIAAGTLATGPLLVAAIGSGSAGATRTALGLALLVYAATALAGRIPVLGPRRGRLLALPSGLLAGTIGYVSGLFVFPTAPYLQALGLDRARLSQSMGIAFTLATVTLAGSLAGHAGIAPTDLAWSAAGTLPSLAGMALGIRLRDRLGSTTFRTLFLLSLGAIGLHFALA